MEFAATKILSIIAKIVLMRGGRGGGDRGKNHNDMYDIPKRTPFRPLVGEGRCGLGGVKGEREGITSDTSLAAPPIINGIVPYRSPLPFSRRLDGNGRENLL